jgi:hypothetical protein
MSEPTGMRMTAERVDRLQRNLAGAGHLYSTERALRDALHDHQLLLRVARAAVALHEASLVNRYYAGEEIALEAALRDCGLLSEGGADDTDA